MKKNTYKDKITESIGEGASKKQSNGNYTLSRRGFLKAAGLSAGAVGLSGLAVPGAALANEESPSALINFAVKEVDSPTYLKAPYSGVENLKRFDARKQTFNSLEVKEKVFNGVHPLEALLEPGVPKVIANVPGFTLLDHSLYQASWVTYRRCPELTQWAPMGLANLPPGVPKWQGSPGDNSKYIKKAARFFGCGATGVTELKEQWVYSHVGNGAELVFSDEHDEPTQEKDKWYIPRRINRAVMMLVAMDGMVSKYSPTMLGAAAAGLGYSQMGMITALMAEFIRGLGYTAIPARAGLSLLVPQAIDAGLGEIGRHGLLINPDFGSMMRITTVFTDLPLALDKPIEFGVAEFCRTCKKCATHCHSKSISDKDYPDSEAACPSNNPGAKRWTINAWTCHRYWFDNGVEDCANCITVCPYSKPQTWAHDVVKAVSSKTSLFNRPFTMMDDVLGYGSLADKNDPNQWWNNDGLNKKWILR